MRRSLKQQHGFRFPDRRHRFFVQAARQSPGPVPRGIADRSSDVQKCAVCHHISGQAFLLLAAQLFNQANGIYMPIQEARD